MGTIRFFTGAGILLAVSFLVTSMASAAYEPGKTQAHGMYLEATETYLPEIGYDGAWEYVINCYTDGSASNDFMMWGFANADILNFADGLGGWDPDYQQNIYQRWDGAAAWRNNYLGWHGYSGPADAALDYASYETDGDGLWELSARPDAMNNTWAAPGEYAWTYEIQSCAYDVDQGASYSDYDGTGRIAGQDGLYMTNWATGLFSSGHNPGLLWSLRVVVPALPLPTCWCPWADTGQYYDGELTWSLPSFGFDHGAGGLYPILGLSEGSTAPPPEGWTEIIELICNAIGTQNMDYDIDGDYDVDEDDVIYFIENMVGYDPDGDGDDDGFGTARGDLNFDGVVNATDLVILHGSFGESGGHVTYGDGDLNCDNNVNATDLQVLKVNFGFSAGGGVPEPTGLAFLGLGAYGLLRRRRHP